MSQYRDSLDAARARIETLEAKLKERDAAIAARDAELAEIRAEVERLRGGSNDDGPPDGGLHGRSGQRALLVALAVCGFATATGYAMVRPTHCVRTVSFSHVSNPQHFFEAAHGGAVIEPGMSRSERAARVRLGRAAGAAIEDAKIRVQSCSQPDGPSGEGSVTVTFEPSGRARVELDGFPYAGTPVGECVADVFRSARVPPFDWEPLTLTTRFSLQDPSGLQGAGGLQGASGMQGAGGL